MFLRMTPHMICEQIVWLIKNSNLNFQLRETPYGLEISLKKRFAQKWYHDSDSSASQQHVPPPQHVVPPQHPVHPQNLVPPPGFASPDQFYAPTRAAEDVQFESKVSTGQSDLKHELEKKETELQLVLHEKKALENDFFQA